MSVLGQGMEISLHQYYQVQPWSSCCFDLGLQLVKKFVSGLGFSQLCCWNALNKLCKHLTIDISMVLFKKYNSSIECNSHQEMCHSTPRTNMTTFCSTVQIQACTFLSWSHCMCYFCLIERVILVLKTGPIKIESNILSLNLLLQSFLCGLQTSCGPWHLSFSKVPFYASDNNHTQISKVCSVQSHHKLFH